jgi:exopolyphosphatase/guanosine-5'-triphosphate,3'-diphosphate pyrophosphatase
MRVATVDIGTNTVLLLVAEKRGRDLVAVEEHATITRLGEGVDKTRTLHPDAIERTNACLTRYGEIVKRLGATRVDVVGTSAMRDAKGSEAVRERVREALGVDARVISGDEEARLTFAGALSGLGLDASSGEIAVFDIGGGSTEIVRGTLDASGNVDAIAYAHSFDVGSVRMTERHVKSDPPTPAERDAVRADLATALATAPRLAKGSVPIGIAGTMTTLAAVALGMDAYDGARVHGHVMQLAELVAVTDRMASMPLEERRQLPGLEPKRADVIVAGGLVALAVLDRMGSESVRISDRGVRWGLAAKLAAG